MTNPIDFLRKDTTNSSKKENGDGDKIQKMKTDFFKIIAATLKNQNPDKPADPSEITQTIATVQQSEEAAKTRQATERLAQQMKDNKLSKALPMQGKKVRYDQSTQHFNGKDIVNFSYQINMKPEEQPNNSRPCTNLYVVDKNGVKVFDKKVATKNGVNKFTWDGRNNKGKLLKEGEYSLKVEAFYEYEENEVMQRKSIDAGAFIDGRVDAIERDGDDLIVIVDGQAVDYDDIISVDFTEDNATKEPQLSDYASYIGKSAIFIDNEIKIEQGSCSIKFDCDFSRPNKAAIKIYNDKGDFVGTSISGHVKEGRNSVIFEASNALSFEDAEEFVNDFENSIYNSLPDGNYTFELFILDNDEYNDADQYEQQSRIISKVITGLDFSEGAYVLCGSEKFSVDSIVQLAENTSSVSLIDEAAKFIGKTAQVKLDSFEYTGKAVKQFVKIPAESGHEYQKATMIIFNEDGEQVARVEKGPDSIIATNKEKVLMVDEGDLYEILDNASREKILQDYGFDYILENGQIAPGFANITELEEIFEKSAGGLDGLRRFVTEMKDEYKKGNLTLDYGKIINGFGNLSAEEQQFFSDSLMVITDYDDIVPNYYELDANNQKLIEDAVNSGIAVTGFYWNGNDENGDRLPKGKYKYKFEVEDNEISTSGTVKTSIREIPDIINAQINEYTEEDGQIIFFGASPENGKVRFAKDEILKITS